MKVLEVFIKLQPTFRALCRWEIALRLPITAAQFIIKSSLFVLLPNVVLPVGTTADACT